MIASLCKNNKNNIIMNKQHNSKKVNKINEGEKLIKQYGTQKPYWMIKRNGKLRHLHREIWEQANNQKLGKRDIIRFINGDSLDCRLENLRLQKQADCIKEGETVIRGYGNRTKFWMIKKDGELQYLHKVIWEKAHGPIDAGCRIFYKNGDSLDCRLENLGIDVRYKKAEDGFETIRINDSGTKYIAVKQGNKWLRKHRYVWEKHNGKIEGNKKVSFKDGDFRNCNIDNLYLTSVVRPKNRKPTAKKTAEEIAEKKRIKEHKKAKRKADAILSARKREQEKKKNSKKKKPLIIKTKSEIAKRNKELLLTPQERNEAHYNNIKDKVMVVDTIDRVTRYVSEKRYNEVYKNKEGCSRIDKKR